MEKPVLRTVTAFLLFFALVAKRTYAMDVKFYTDQNYVDYADGHQDEDDFRCHELNNRIAFNSVKTDTCLRVYSKRNCQPTRIKDCTEDVSCREYSIRVDKDTPQFPPDDTLASWNTSRYVRSFRMCIDVKRSPLRFVRMFNRPAYIGREWQEWSNDCTCQNIPKEYQGGKDSRVSIDNFNNAMKIFSEKNCLGESDFLPAGDNMATLFAPFHNPKFNVLSIRPYDTTVCIDFSAQISHFFFQPAASGKPSTQKVSLGKQGIIENDADAAITELFRYSVRVPQTLSFSIPTGYIGMYNVSTSFRANVIADGEMPLIKESVVARLIVLQYKYFKGDTNLNKTTITIITKELVPGAQAITVPACHSCTLNAFVNQEVNFPIKYDSYANITAFFNGKQMSSDEIVSSWPPEVDYFENADERTIVGLINGTAYAQFGVDVYIETDCKPIPNCPNNVPAEIHNTFRSQSTDQGSSKIGKSMGKESDWNSLSESSFPI